jgi:hypothetical protein
VQGAIERYTSTFLTEASTPGRSEQRPGTGEFRFVRVTPVKEFFVCGEEKVVRYVIERRKPFAGTFFVSCLLIDERGFALAQCDSRAAGHWVQADADRYEGQFTLKTPWLKPGMYRLAMYLCSAGILDRHEDACHLHVIPVLPYAAAADPEATVLGAVLPDFSYHTAPSDAEGLAGGVPTACEPTEVL